MVEEYPPRSVPVRLRDLPHTSARMPAAMPWAAPSPLELVNLVADKQVEEALHPVLDVVGQRVAGRAGPVGLPEGGVAGSAGVLAPVQVRERQRHAVLVDDLRRAVGAAGDPEGLPRLLLPQEPSLGYGPPLV